MKKYILLTQLLMLSILFVHAQEVSKPTQPEKKFCLALSAGPSFPIGKFGTRAYVESGFARPGFDLNLNFGYHIKNNFGLSSSVFYAIHKLYEDDIKSVFSNGITSVASDHWQLHGIVLGPMGTVNISEKVFLDFRIMGGVASANFPVFKFEGIQTPEKWKTSFASRIGTVLRYNFNSNISFYSNFDYNYLKPTWNFTDIVDGKPVSADVTQRMETIDLNVGVGYNF